VSGLLETAAIALGRTPSDIADEAGSAGSGALKGLTTEAVNEFLADHRARRAAITVDDAAAVLRAGNERAQLIADATLPEVRAQQRAGTSFGGATEFQIRLRQIRRRAAEHLVLLLEEPDPLLQFPRLGGVDRRLTRPVAVLDTATHSTLEGATATVAPSSSTTRASHHAAGFAAAMQRWTATAIPDVPGLNTTGERR